MLAVLEGALLASFHGVGGAFYDLFSLSSKARMKDWTRLQWGALASTTALNILRPNIQRKFDEKLGSKLSKYCFDLTPFIALGLAQWKANRSLKASLCVGGYFALVHKVINYQQHHMAWDKVWSSRAEPKTNYEELALARGKADNREKDLGYTLKDARCIQSLCLIQAGRVDEGTALFKKHQDRIRITFSLDRLLDAQVSFFIRDGQPDKACEAIDAVDQELIQESNGVRFIHYSVMIRAYVEMKRFDKLQELLEKMERELPELENQKKVSFQRYPFR
ncbi:MAG: hypothetical protein HRU43_04050, partial [Simkaniaceae bacterium]|nr:hypothetical protein [Simkaniaceae bacterium]